MRYIVYIKNHRPNRIDEIYQHCKILPLQHDQQNNVHSYRPQLKFIKE